MLILFAERFADDYDEESDSYKPPHADSFCRKVCKTMIRQPVPVMIRLMLILFAERFATQVQHSDQ